MYIIYYLTTEQDGNIPRYIGYTSKSLENRLRLHINDSIYKRKNRNENHKTKWINKRINDGYKILIFKIEETDNIIDCHLLEKKYIGLYKDLTNSTNGGEECKIFTEDVRIKISNGLKNYYTKNEFTESQLKAIESRKKDFPYERLYDLYITQNLNLSEISIILNVSLTHIGKLISKNKLKKIKKDKYGKLCGKKFNTEDIINMYKAGIPIKEISEKYNIHSVTVIKTLKLNGIKLGLLKDKRNEIRDKFDKEDIINMYNSGEKLIDIANKYHVDIKSISKYLRINNIERRENIQIKSNKKSREKTVYLKESMIKLFKINNDILKSCESIGITHSMFSHWMYRDNNFKKEIETIKNKSK